MEQTALHLNEEYITVENALKTVSLEAKDVSISETSLLELIVGSCKVKEMGGGVQFITTRHLHNFMRNFIKAVATDDWAMLHQERGLKWPMVDMEEFLESRYYMNQKGSLRPAVKYKLLELYEDPFKYIEFVATGAIGIGKNYAADMIVARMLYELSCYHNAQVEFDLAPGSSIVFIMQSMSYNKAKKVVFDQFAERLKLSPYFKEHFMWDPDVRSELRFPNQLFVTPVAGNDTAALGMNVFGGVIDEMNFMKRTKDSKALEYALEEEYDQAERIYRTIIRRMKSRFQQKGKLPGKLVLVSSANYPGDFTDRKKDEAKIDKTILIMDYAIWEALPSDRFSEGRFLVEVGNDIKRSQIIEAREAAQDADDVIEVPIDLLSDFQKDIDAALRDHAGIATGTKNPFIPQRELIQQAQDTFNVLHPNGQLFKMTSVELSTYLDPESPDWETIVNLQYIQEDILDKRLPFAAHIDLAVTQDAAGLGIGHINSYKLLPKAKVFNPKTGDFLEIFDTRVPVYQIDGLIQFKAPPGGEIDFDLIRDLVIFLKGELFLKWTSLDRFQSVQMIQAFRKAAIRAGVVSVDTTPAPYQEVKQAIKDTRLYMPPHKVGAKELRELERDGKTGKIDHPEGGSKDVSDAIAGVVYMLQMKEASYGQALSPTGSRSRGRRDDSRVIRRRRVHA